MQAVNNETPVLTQEQMQKAAEHVAEAMEKAGIDAGIITENAEVKVRIRQSLKARLANTTRAQKAAIGLGLVGVIGAAVYGVVQYRKKVAAAEAKVIADGLAEMEAHDQATLAVVTPITGTHG